MLFFLFQSHHQFFGNKLKKLFFFFQKTCKFPVDESKTSDLYSTKRMNWHPDKSQLSLGMFFHVFVW